MLRSLVYFINTYLSLILQTLFVPEILNNPEILYDAEDTLTSWKAFSASRKGMDQDPFS